MEKIKEMSLEEKYDKLFDSYVLTEAMYYAFLEELGVLDKYYDFSAKLTKEIMPKYLGIALKVFTTIAPGKALQQLTDQMVYSQQSTIPLSNIELTRVSDREVAIRIKNCPILKRARDLVKKLGLDIDPKFICDKEVKVSAEASKGFALGVSMRLEEDGCVSTLKIK